MRAGNAAEGEEAYISYPANIYVFDSGDACVATTKLASGSDEISLKLPEGTYGVYAVAGADDVCYALPTKANASKSSAISLNPGSVHSDLMSANNTVSLAYGEENTLTLSLERKVMLIESVKPKSVIRP